MMSTLAQVVICLGVTLVIIQKSARRRWIFVQMVGFIIIIMYCLSVWHLAFELRVNFYEKNITQVSFV